MSSGPAAPGCRECVSHEEETSTLCSWFGLWAQQTWIRECGIRYEVTVQPNLTSLRTCIKRNQTKNIHFSHISDVIQMRGKVNIWGGIHE